MIKAQFPEKLEVLFQPKRYKILYGGRGGAKSWSIARALLIKGTKERLRVLCCREIQKSIKDSVHKLLSDQIEALGLQSEYIILETEIRGRNGTEFAFAGLSGQTIMSLKSFEGIDIAWVEEAVNVSAKSWSVLTPTIRKPGSEIWISFNPELDTDETYKRYVATPPPDAAVVEVNYSDNPWFSDVLDKERQHCQLTQPEDYPNIWLGQCRATVKGAIYAKEVLTMVREQRIARVPYDPRLKVHTVWDLGWNDSMAIAVVQRSPFDVRIIDYLESDHQTLDWYAAKLNAMPYNWGYDWLPHDGFSGDYKTGRSAYDILRRFTRRVKPLVDGKFPIPKLSVEQGIRAARMMLPLLAINNTPPPAARLEESPRASTAWLIECLKRYRRGIPESTGEPGAPVHDEYSHGADVIRHLGLIVEKLTNDEEQYQAPVVPAWRPVDAGVGLG